MRAAGWASASTCRRTSATRPLSTTWLAVPLEHFGRIDVWVNNAAVGLFSRFEDAPLADFRRVIETDLFGYVYGARAVLPLFYRRGRGTLINVGSIMSEVPGPYVSAYTIAKHGVTGPGRMPAARGPAGGS